MRRQPLWLMSDKATGPLRYQFSQPSGSPFMRAIASDKGGNGYQLAVSGHRPVREYDTFPVLAEVGAIT